MRTIFGYLFLLFSISINAQTCDSLIIINTEYHVDGDVYPFSIEIDSIKNGVVISKTKNGLRTELNYDSLQRLISVVDTDSTVFTYNAFPGLINTDYYTFNGTGWEFRTDTARKAHLYNSNHLDSLEIYYSWDGSLLQPFSKKNYFYNANDTLVRIEFRRLISNQWIFTTLEVVTYPIGTPGVFRVDTAYQDSVPGGYPRYLTYYDSLNRIIDYEEWFFSLESSYSQHYEYSCNEISEYYTSCNGCHSGYFAGATFDSLCRYKTSYYGHSSMSDSWSYNKEYYYTDCNHMALIVSHDENICNGDTVTLSASHFGGTPPFQIQWTPSTGLESDTSSTTRAWPDTLINYIFTVTDSNGVTISDTVIINSTSPPYSTLHIESIDTTSICQSAVLSTDSVPGFTYYWTFNGQHVSNNSSHLNIISNGVYNLYVDYGNCAEVYDTLVFNYFTNPPPSLNIIGGCNQLFANPSSPSQIKWYFNNQLIADSSRDTIMVNQSGWYTAIAIDSNGCHSEISNQVYLPIFSISTTVHNTCENTCAGSISVFSNGFPHYLWSTGDSTNYISNLCPGIYSIEVTNSYGCHGTKQDTIKNFPKGVYSYITSPASDSLSCDGIVIPTDSLHSPYSAYYLWDDTTNGYFKDGLCPGWHTVVTRPFFSNCPQTDSFYIGFNPSTDTCSILFNKSNPVCNGASSGKVNVGSSTGSPFACQWLSPPLMNSFNPRPNNLPAGTYTCTIIDQHGCKDTNTVTLTDPPALIITNSVYQSACDDSCVITLSATGGIPPYNFYWNGIPGPVLHSCTPSNNYFIRDSIGCTLFGTVTQPAVSPITFNTIQHLPSCELCSDGSLIIIASGGNQPYTYSIDGSPASNDTINNLTFGNYTVCVTGADGCSLCSGVNIINGVQNIAEFSDFNIYPNPFTESATFNFRNYKPATQTKLIVCDILGNIVDETKINSTQFIFKRENLANRIYIFSITENNNIVVRGKFILE